MDKRFHLFVRRHDAGVSAQVIGHPHLTSFGPDIDAARADLAHVLGKLLARGELWRETTHFDDVRLRKIDLTVRALQRGRLLEVPMRFSILTYGGGRPDKGQRRGPLRVLVPRLEVDGLLNDAADLIPFAEELIRHELYLAPLSRLLEVAYSGDESLDSLTVTARPPEPAARKPPEKRAPRLLPAGLDEACRFLNAEAAAGMLDRAYQRDGELLRLCELATARARASVLLVGPAGAGKTALVNELAHRAHEEGGPAAGVEVYSTSAGRIIAGMRYLGEWQARVERMLASLRARRAVLHLESLGELVSLGDRDGQDVARHLLPAVESGDVALIIEATPEDVARAERTHAALVQALRPLALAPLAPAVARVAMAQAAGRLGRARRVAFADAALDRALDLAERFGEGILPGSAVEILRAAAGERSQTGTAARPAGPAEITAAFCARTGFPAALVDPAVALDPAAVRAAFAERVLGQEAAAELFAQLVITLKTNLSDPRRPLGSFLLLGPTGVGKTESALALAAYLFGREERLSRFDMAEYAAPGSAARLVAVGGSESTLAKRVRAQPFGVVLLDEIEKADPGVHDLLLQILGEGRLTDGTGRTVSFRNTIIVLTSNLGADRAGRSLGFAAGDFAAEHDAHYRAAAAAFFRPELWNRIDHVVAYRPLGPAVVARLAERALEQALAREGLTRRGVRVAWDPAVVARLAALGFDPRLGARPLKRAVDQQVVARVARLLAGGERPVALRLRVDGEGAIAVEVE